MPQEKELQQLKNRFRDLAERSYSQNIYTFTGFLGLSELAVFYQMERELNYAGIVLSGGYAEADRKIVRFGEEARLGYETSFPIVCINIRPLMAKFAENLSHRDFLGALMNLGIERSTIGDIKVGEKEAYLFCVDSIAPFICENLEQIKHTHVKCTVVGSITQFLQEEPELIIIQVQSLRIDAVIAKVYNISREKSLELFRAKKVYVDGRLCENNSRVIKQSETVNARGYGKFRIVGEPGETRKGKLKVEAAVYR